MKKLILVWLLVAIAAYGKGLQITASGGAPIPTSFSASNTQSQVLECKGNVIEILNQTTEVLAVGFGTSSAVPGYDYNYVPPGANSGNSFKPMGGVAAGTYLYIRAAGSAATSGTVQVACYYEDK